VAATIRYSAGRLDKAYEVLARAQEIPQMATESPTCRLMSGANCSRMLLVQGRLSARIKSRKLLLEKMAETGGRA